MTKNSNLPGVYSTKKQDGSPYFRASLTHKGKHISLGSYSTMELAHQAYSEACIILRDPALNTESCQGEQALLFEKRISLMNLRDNGIYPIPYISGKIILNTIFHPILP